jgi:short-subunit dehydrogenase
VYATKAVLPSMLRRGRGEVVNVASVAGRFGAPLEAAYSATKFAMVGLTESLSVELRGTGVHVSMVNPGLVDTDFFEARGHPLTVEGMKPMRPERVADLVVRVVERGRSEAFVPRWMRAAYLFKTFVPPAYRAGSARAVHKQLAVHRSEWR